MSQILWGRWLVVSAGLVGAGYALMRYTTPTEDQLYEKLSPDLKRQVDEIRRRREGQGKEYEEKLRKAAESGEIIWADDTSSIKARAPPGQKR